MSKKVRNSDDVLELKVNGISSFIYQYHLKSGDRYYFAIPHLFKSNVLSRETKDELCTTYFRPVVSNVSCT